MNDNETKAVNHDILTSTFADVCDALSQLANDEERVRVLNAAAELFGLVERRKKKQAAQP